MKIEEKINRRFLIFLLGLEVKKSKIAELLSISRKTLFTYLQNFPISESEFHSMTFDKENLEQVVMNYFGENSIKKPIQQSFRQPENKVQKQKIIHTNKVVQKSSSVKPVKKDDEIIEKENHFAELDAYQNMLEENIAHE